MTIAISTALSRVLLFYVGWHIRPAFRQEMLHRDIWAAGEFGAQGRISVSS